MLWCEKTERRGCVRGAALHRLAGLGLVGACVAFALGLTSFCCTQLELPLVQT